MKDGEETKKGVTKWDYLKPQEGDSLGAGDAGSGFRVPEGRTIEAKRR